MLRTTLILLFCIPVILPAQSMRHHYVSFPEGKVSPDMVGMEQLRKIRRAQWCSDSLAIEIQGSVTNQLARERMAFLCKWVASEVPDASIKEQYTFHRHPLREEDDKPIRVSVRLLEKTASARSIAFPRRGALDEVLSEAMPETQRFTIDPDTDCEVVLESGSRILLPAGSFELRLGQDEVKLEVTEFNTPGALIAGDLPTVSGGSALRTGGSMFIDARSGGEPVALANRNSARIFFAQEKGSGNDGPDEMRIYTGIRDRLGNVDWVEKVPVPGAGRQYGDRGYIMETKLSPKFADSEAFKDIFDGGSLTLWPFRRKTFLRNYRPRVYRRNREWRRTPKVYRDPRIPLMKRPKGYRFQLRLGLVNCDKPVPPPPPKDRIDMKIMIASSGNSRYYLKLDRMKVLVPGKITGDGEVVFKDVEEDRPAILVAIKEEKKVNYIAMESIYCENKTISKVKWKPVTPGQLKYALERLEW